MLLVFQIFFFSDFDVAPGSVMKETCAIVSCAVWTFKKSTTLTSMASITPSKRLNADHGRTFLHRSNIV